MTPRRFLSAVVLSAGVLATVATSKPIHITDGEVSLGAVAIDPEHPVVVELAWKARKELAQAQDCEISVGVRLHDGVSVGDQGALVLVVEGEEVAGRSVEAVSEALELELWLDAGVEGEAVLHVEAAGDAEVEGELAAAWQVYCHDEAVDARLVLEAERIFSD